MCAIFRENRRKKDIPRWLSSSEAAGKRAKHFFLPWACLCGVLFFNSKGGGEVTAVGIGLLRVADCSGYCVLKIGVNSNGYWVVKGMADCSGYRVVKRVANCSGCWVKRVANCNGYWVAKRVANCSGYWVC